MQIINNHQNNSAKKIVIIDDSSRESNIKKAAKYLSILAVGGGLGYGTKAIVNIFKNKQHSIVVNGEILEYLRRRFDTKPENWQKSPRYYFIKFLDKLMKYDDNIKDEELILTLKYIILAVVPTSDSFHEQFFGSIVSSILSEIKEKYQDSHFNVLFDIILSENASIARKFVTRGISDTGFLEESKKEGLAEGISRWFKILNPFSNNTERSKLSVEQAMKVKDGIKKYFSDLSFNLKKMDLSRYSNEAAKEKIKIEKNEKKLDENDLNTIKELYNSTEIDQKIKDDIINQNFGGYKLGLLFSDLLFKTTIFQIFGTRQEKNT
ncbi:MAG: hypothetical protein IJQ10_03710 [Clostridia bacterium]|nr:hypothetical protein [Clostridia bacterium]